MILKIRPKFSEKIWGGEKLKNYGFNIPSDKTGEAWLISGYKDNESEIEGENLLLNEYYKNNKNKFNNYNSINFPLLIKLIDANDDLSIQVHPDDESAKFLERDKEVVGKSEAWYVYYAAPKSDIIIGTNTIDKKESKKLINAKSFEALIKKVKISGGEYFNIEPGTVHAIRKNTIIYEVQQSSDLTYRLYDYNRLENGKPRELHIDKSLYSIKYDQSKIFQNEIKNYQGYSERTLVIDNSKFFIEEWNVNDSHFKLPKENNFVLATNFENKIKVNNVLIKPFESFIITSDDLNNINFEGKTKLIISYPK